MVNIRQHMVKVNLAKRQKNVYLPESVWSYLLLRLLILLTDLFDTGGRYETDYSNHSRFLHPDTEFTCI